MLCDARKVQDPTRRGRESEGERALQIDTSPSVRLRKHILCPPARLEAVFKRLEAARELLELRFLAPGDVGGVRGQLAGSLCPGLEERLDERGAFGNVFGRQSGFFRLSSVRCRSVPILAGQMIARRWALTALLKVLEVVGFPLRELRDRNRVRR